MFLRSHLSTGSALHPQYEALQGHPGGLGSESSAGGPGASFPDGTVRVIDTKALTLPAKRMMGLQGAQQQLQKLTGSMTSGHQSSKEREMQEVTHTASMEPGKTRERQQMEHKESSSCRGHTVPQTC